MNVMADPDLGARLRSAARLEPERLPRLKLIGTQWAERAEASLLADHGADIRVEYEGAAPLESPSDGGARPALIVVAPSRNWPVPALLTADDAFRDLAAELLLGGDGSMPAASARPATELDRRFAEAVLAPFAQGANAVLSDVLDIALVPERAVTAAAAERLDALAGEGGTRFLQFSFRVTFGRCTGLVAVSIPDQVLAIARRKLGHLPEPPAPAVDRAWARDIEEGLLDADMVLTALLDEKPTTLGEIAGFHVGQTIVLDAGLESPIVIECEDQRLFRGRMGRSRDSYLVRIEEKIDPTEEFIDDILAD